MADDALTRVVAESLVGLERLPTEGAWVTLTSDDPGHSMSIRGNSRGLAWLSRILLRCSVEPEEPAELEPAGKAMAELDQLYTRSHTFPRLLVRRQEHPPADEAAKLHGFGVWRCGLVVFIVGCVIVLGVLLAARIVLRWP